MSFLMLSAAFVCQPTALRAQFRADSTWHDVRHAGGDIWALWTSPVRASASDLGGFAVFASGVGVAAALDEPLYHWILDHPSAWPVHVLHPLRESARFPLYKLGTGAYVIPLSTAAYLAGVMSKSRALRDAGMACLAGDLTIAGVRQTIFLFLTRERPVGSPDDPFVFGFPGTQDPRHQSFFSGHVANSMACASFVSHRFDLHAAEPVFYTFVMAIGAGRVVDGQHWLSDTVMGGMFGYLVGRTISGRFAARDRAASPNVSTLPIRFSFSF